MASRSTELEAVNEILSLLGRRPVNSLTPPDVTPDAAFALQRLRWALKSILNLGWHWNREESVRFVPDGNDEVVIPDNILRLDSARKSKGGYRANSSLTGYYDLIMRVDPSDALMKLYDRHAEARNQDPFKFPELSEVRLDVVRALDFEEVPEACRQYATIKAGRAVQARLIGDPTLHRFYLEDELAARALLLKEETDTAQPNILNERLARWTVNRDFWI